MRRTLVLDGRPRRVEAREAPERGCLTLSVDDTGETFEARAAPGGWTITTGRRTFEAGVTVERAGEIVVRLEGRVVRITAGHGSRNSPAVGKGRATGAAEIRTPMPGRVVRVLRDEGEEVAAGDGVLVFEAMKMQNEIRSPASGVIANMRAVAGAPMEGGELLFAVEPASSP